MPCQLWPSDDDDDVRGDDDGDSRAIILEMILSRISTILTPAHADANSWHSVTYVYSQFVQKRLNTTYDRFWHVICFYPQYSFLIYLTIIVMLDSDSFSNCEETWGCRMAGVETLRKWKTEVRGNSQMFEKTIRKWKQGSGSNLRYSGNEKSRCRVL